jgi:hypothetical protein
MRSRSLSYGINWPCCSAANRNHDQLDRARRDRRPTRLLPARRRRGADRAAADREWTYGHVIAEYSGHDPGLAPQFRGRPANPVGVRAQIVRLATENPTWGIGACTVSSPEWVTRSASAVWKILRAAGIDPAPRRTGLT